MITVFRWQRPGLWLSRSWQHTASATIQTLISDIWNISFVPYRVINRVPGYLTWQELEMPEKDCLWTMRCARIVWSGGRGEEESWPLDQSRQLTIVCYISQDKCKQIKQIIRHANLQSIQQICSRSERIQISCPKLWIPIFHICLSKPLAKNRIHWLDI